MRGNFEVEKSQYPVAALPSGEGQYYLTNMIGLERLHTKPITDRERAHTIAAQANSLHRSSRAQGYKGHGPNEAVIHYIQEATK